MRNAYLINNVRALWALPVNSDSTVFDCLGSTVEVDDSLMDPPLKSIPRLRALTTRSLAIRDAESFGWHPDWTLHMKIRLLRSLDEVTADWGRERGGGREGGEKGRMVANTGLDPMRIILRHSFYPTNPFKTWRNVQGGVMFARTGTRYLKNNAKLSLSCSVVPPRRVARD